MVEYSPEMLRWSLIAKSLRGNKCSVENAVLRTYVLTFIIYFSDLPDDLELTELNLNEIDAKVEEEMVQEELEREQEALAANENLPPVRMPFPELRYLNVAFNKVRLSVYNQCLHRVMAASIN